LFEVTVKVAREQGRNKAGTLDSPDS